MFEGIEGAPTQKEIERAFKLGSLNPAQWADVATLDDGAKIRVGDKLRVIIVAQPSWLDRINDTAQENAEEHTNEILGEYQKYGLVLQLSRVDGQVFPTKMGDPETEVYVYEFEVAAVIDAPYNSNPPGVEVDPLAATVEASTLKQVLRVIPWAAALGISAFVFGVASQTRQTFNESGGTVVLVALAVIAVAVAYSIGKFKK